MKWPLSLTLIRHAESAYNVLKAQKLTDPLYKKFVTSYDTDWRSEQTRSLALEVHATFPVTWSEEGTPLTESGITQARAVGRALKASQDLPDVIYVSPYVRTLDTLGYIQELWPELRDTRVIQDERLREQEFGLRSLYNDWRITRVFHPDYYDLRSLQGMYWFRQPMGENVPDVRARVRSWINTLTRDFAGKKILAITHHITILSLRANLERLSPEEFVRLDKEEEPGHCTISTYKGDSSAGVDGRFKLDCYNQDPG